MKATAFCKINLTLEILGTRRADGFHDIASIMHKVPLGDSIELEAQEGSGKISFLCNADVCPDEDNIAYKAAKSYLDLYSRKTEKNADVSIELKKITPSGAGLGGGSADGALVLDLLQNALGGVDDKEILSLAASLGSDVPFCLRRYTSAVCTGRGEICEDIQRLPDGTCLLIAKPSQSINTKGIYREYDELFGDDYSKQATLMMKNALDGGNLENICSLLVNDFEKVCISRLSQIRDIKNDMLSGGAVGSQMSGSGSAVFGLFDSEGACVDCKNRLLFKGLSEVFAFTDEDFKKMYMDE